MYRTIKIYYKKKNTLPSADTAAATSSSWAKPLKKISKEDAERNKAPAQATVIVTVKKILPPREPEVVEWPLKADEKKPKRSQRGGKKNQDSYNKQAKESNSSYQNYWAPKNNGEVSESITEPSTASVSMYELEKSEASQSTAWASPLKKVCKEESENKSNYSKTVIVRVEKILPKEPEIEVWPLKSQKNIKNGKRKNHK